VSLSRLPPVLRPSSFRASITFARDALNAGMTPNIKPVAREIHSAKNKYGRIQLRVRSSRIPQRPHQQLQARVPINIPKCTAENAEKHAFGE